jgi:hypothetical protein
MMIKVFGAIFPAEFSYVISLQKPKSSLLTKLFWLFSLPKFSYVISCKNPNPHLFSSFFSSQLPIKRKPSNRSNQDRQKKQEKKREEGGEVAGGGGRATERKEKQKAKNAITYSPHTAATTEGTCSSYFFLFLFSLCLSLFFQLL